MNFFEVRDAIVEVLKRALPGVSVLVAEDLDGVEESAQPVPAVHVVYLPFRVRESSLSGRTSQIDQQWMVVCVVKHDGDKRKAAREAGTRVEPMVNGVLSALMGWRHASGMRPLVLTSPPAPKWRRPFYYFPLTFSASAALCNKE